jgi:hypothetical protein
MAAKDINRQNINGIRFKSLNFKVAQFEILIWIGNKQTDNYFLNKNTLLLTALKKAIVTPKKHPCWWVFKIPNIAYRNTIRYNLKLHL